MLLSRNHYERENTSLLLLILSLAVFGIITTVLSIIGLLPQLMNQLTQETSEFANSLFVSFSNLGITVGTALAGWLIIHFGTHNLVWVGIVFAGLAFFSILSKILLCLEPAISR